MNFDQRNGPDSLPDSYGEYGGLEPSPTKALIGLAIMIVIGVALYQFGGTTNQDTSSATPTISRDVANNNR
jgi:hypothetical protein